MALIKGKQIQDTSVSLSKLSGGTGSVTLTTGTITTPAANLIVSTAPTQATHAVNKEYVDAVATGLDVKKSVRALYTQDTLAGGGTPAITVVNTAGGAPLDADQFYTALTQPTPLPMPLEFDGVELQDGDRVLIAITTPTRQKINGIWVVDATGRFTRAEDADNQNQGGEVSGGLFTFVEEGTVYGDTGWVLTFPNGPITTLWDPTFLPAATTDIVFTQFSAAGVAEAGVGLSRTGTKFDVNYDNSSIGINGSDQLYIKADGVTNAMLVNDFTTFAGNSGSGNIALGGTLTISGDTAGIDTSFSGSTLTISLDLSELAAVQSLADSDYLVATNGTERDGRRITFADLKTQIGAASQLQIMVEAATSDIASFDLDIDTLDFQSGVGLTFTKSDSTEDATDTLILTLSNNALNVHQSTSLTAAANANTDITLTSAAAEIFSVTVNGVALKKTTNWIWPQASNSVVRITGLPYAIETSDDIEITYRVR
jgi:hypothetical protein